MGLPVEGGRRGGVSGLAMRMECSSSRFLHRIYYTIRWVNIQLSPRSSSFRELRVYVTTIICPVLFSRYVAQPQISSKTVVPGWGSSPFRWRLDLSGSNGHGYLVERYPKDVGHDQSAVSFTLASRVPPRQMLSGSSALPILSRQCAGSIATAFHYPVPYF